MDVLEKLSLGRNVIKKLDGLDPVAGTLQQLWISYNQIEKLVHFEASWHIGKIPVASQIPKSVLFRFICISCCNETWVSGKGAGSETYQMVAPYVT